MNNGLSNMSGLPLGATPQQQQRYAIQQFQNQLAAQQQGVQNQIQQQQQQQQQHPPVDLSWQSSFPKEMRDQQIRTLEAQLAVIFKSNVNLLKGAAIPPNILRTLAARAEDMGWSKASSVVEYQQLCNDNVRLIARWQFQRIQQQQMGVTGQTDQQQQQAAQMMLLQQNTQNQQQLHQAQQGQMPQPQQQNQQQLQQMAAAAAQNQGGINSMAAFQRTFPQQQDASSALTVTMQNYIQSQQQVSQQQHQRAQQQQQQQHPQQPQMPQQPAQSQQQQPNQAQQQMLRQQFQNASQGNQNLNPLNASNIYGQQHQPQQTYTTNLAASQRQGGLSTLNQPINPTMTTPQAQQTPQQRPAQFPQLTDANAATAMFNQVRNPLQSPAQLQPPLTPGEIQKIGEDIGNYRYFVSMKGGKAGADSPPHLKELYERAMARFQAAKVSYPNLMEQVRTSMNNHIQHLEANRVNQAAAGGVGAAEGQGIGSLQQPVQQPPQQAQTAATAAAAGRAQLNRLPNQQPQQEQQVAQLQQPGMMPQFQNLRAQTQAAQAQSVQRSVNATSISNPQSNQQGQQSLLQPGQVPNVSNMTPHQLAVMQQMHLQQQRNFANSQQLLSNLQSGGNQNVTPLQMQQFQAQLAQAQQAQQAQQSQEQPRPGNANPNAINPNQMIPSEFNPHNFPIPFDSQQRLLQAGIPADRLVSWKVAIDWFSEAAKTGIISNDACNKIRAEYQQVSQAMGRDPRAFVTQHLQRNMAGANQTQNQLLMNQMVAQRQQAAAQAQKLSLQQMGIPTPVQGSLPPQVQFNMTNLQQQMPLQIAQPQAQQLQAQQALQQQQQPQSQPQILAPQQQIPQQQQQQQQQMAAAAQQRKPPARPTPKKGATKKGPDSSNPMVIGNTPTPTNIPTPSPAQIAAQLPNTTPMNVASPNLPLPAATPQGLGISSVDMQTPPQGQPMQIPEQKVYDHTGALAFVRNNIEKIQNLMVAGANNLQLKNLTQEEKDQMRGYLSNPQTQEFIGRIDKLAPLMLLITKDEHRTIEFLRLVTLMPFIQNNLTNVQRQLAFMILDAASKDRHICTPTEWLQNYWPSIYRQVTSVMSVLAKGSARPSQAPINAASPMGSNPAGIPITFSSKHALRQEDLRLPETKRRFSAGPGTSSSPTSTADPATVPSLAQTPVTMATPVPVSVYPSQTTGTKRPSTGSPVNAQPNKMQISASGPIPVRDRTQGDPAQDEAVAKRLAREQAEEQARQEARKDPLQYVKNAARKAFPPQTDGENGVPARPQPVYQGISDRVKKDDNRTGTSSTTAAGTSPSTGAPQGGKGQLPSPPCSGTMASRTLAEAFQNTTDIEFSLKSLYSYEPVMEGFTGLSGSTVVDGEEEKRVKEESEEIGFLSPLGGDLEFNDPYAWASGLRFSWSGGDFLSDEVAV